MLDVPDLRFLVTIAGAPSLAAAARGLGVSRPAVSQRLSLIEARLHLHLVERGHGTLRLTAEGRHLVSRARGILADLEILSEELGGGDDRIEGPFHVVASPGFGRRCVAPILMAFASTYPDLHPGLVLSTDPLRSIRSAPWDVLVHVGALPDLGMTEHHLVSERRLLVASEAYAARCGLPDDPGDLAAHRIGVIEEGHVEATLRYLHDGTGNAVSVSVRPAFACNDGEMLRLWALAGHGIAECPEWSVAEDIASDRLLPVLPDWSLPDIDIVVLRNPRALRAARIDAFLEHLSKSPGQA